MLHDHTISPFPFACSLSLLLSILHMHTPCCQWVWECFCSVQTCLFTTVKESSTLSWFFTALFPLALFVLPAQQPSCYIFLNPPTVTWIESATCVRELVITDCTMSGFLLIPHIWHNMTCSFTGVIMLISHIVCSQPTRWVQFKVRTWHVFRGWHVRLQIRISNDLYSGQQFWHTFDKPRC